MDQTGTQTLSVSVQETRLLRQWISELYISQLMSSQQNAPIRRKKKTCYHFSFSICILHVFTQIQRTTLHHQDFVFRQQEALDVIVLEILMQNNKCTCPPVSLFIFLRLKACLKAREMIYQSNPKCFSSYIINL